MTEEFTKAVETELRLEEQMFKDIKQDLNFVVELNKELANLFEDIKSAFPTSYEIEHIQNNFESIKIPEKFIVPRAGQSMDDAIGEYILKRKHQLRRFLSLMKRIEGADPYFRPKRYEEIDK
jgi:hypothetical protein